jgi:hypothetical protein
LGSFTAGPAIEKQCKEFERLQGQIADANAAFNEQEDITARTIKGRGKGGQILISLLHSVVELLGKNDDSFFNIIYLKLTCEPCG